MSIVASAMLAGVGVVQLERRVGAALPWALRVGKRTLTTVHLDELCELEPAAIGALVADERNGARCKSLGLLMRVVGEVGKG